jgi:hypothetical protein
LQFLNGLGVKVVVMRKERPLIEASKRADFSLADLRITMAEADDIH